MGEAAAAEEVEEWLPPDTSQLYMFDSFKEVVQSELSKFLANISYWESLPMTTNRMKDAIPTFAELVDWGIARRVRRQVFYNDGGTSSATYPGTGYYMTSASSVTNLFYNEYEMEFWQWGPTTFQDVWNILDAELRLETEDEDD